MSNFIDYNVFLTGCKKCDSLSILSTTDDSTEQCSPIRYSPVDHPLDLIEEDEDCVEIEKAVTAVSKALATVRSVNSVSLLQYLLVVC